MPRLTSQNYLHRREWFANLWASSPAALSLIDFVDQRYLHDYFRPEQDWSDAECLAYRAQITKTQPSLPQCAGRAAHHLLDAMEAGRVRQAAEVEQTKSKRKGGVVRLQGQAHSEINRKQLAQALLAALHEQRKA